MSQALKIDFTKDEWNYMMRAIDGSVTNVLFLVNDLFAYSKEITLMPKGLEDKLNNLDLMDCANLHSFLFQFRMMRLIHEEKNQLRSQTSSVNYSNPK